MLIDSIPRFIFGCLDHAAEGDEALENYEMRMFLGQDNHAGLNTVAGTSTSGSSNVNIGKSVSTGASTVTTSSGSEEKLFKKKIKEEKKRSPSKGFGAK